MSQNRSIYLLDPKKLSPETIAVTFAKTSRSPLSFAEIAAELSDQGSADFKPEWVVGYGHSSVAEHAVLHIAAENISRLAVECLESNRLASYTEKSSRYQIWGLDFFHIPTEFTGTPAETLYSDTCTRLFSAYQQAVEGVSVYLQRTESPLQGESPAAFKNRLRTQCADVCRYYLPASALANVGMTINARALEHAIRKLLSHPLDEVRRIGVEIKRVSQENVPTLVKYADQDHSFLRLQEAMSCLPAGLSPTPESHADWFRLVHADPDGELRVLAALLLRFGNCSYEQAMQTLQRADLAEKQQLAEHLLGGLGAHDLPARELEYACLSVEFILDQGAWFELKRHRMLTLSTQTFTPHLGFAVPRLIADAGLGEAFTAEMHAAAQAYAQLEAVHMPAAAYILPNAFNRRVLLGMNLRSALHLVQLRSAANAHFAMRRAAQRLAEEIRRQFPYFAPWFDPQPDETWQSITSEFFHTVK